MAAKNILYRSNLYKKKYKYTDQKE